MDKEVCKKFINITNNIWQTDTTFVAVNKLHTFYQVFLSGSRDYDVLANHSFIANLFLFPSSRMLAYHLILSCIIFYLNQHKRALCVTHGSSSLKRCNCLWLSFCTTSSSWTMVVAVLIGLFQGCVTMVSSFQSQD